MTRNVRSLAPIGALLSLVVLTAGCEAKAKADPIIKIGIDINSPTTPTTPAAPTSVDVSPKGAIVPCGGTLQLTAKVLPDSAYQSVVWSTSGGSITSTGLLTAPTVNGTYTVTAKSTQNYSVVGTTTFKVENCPGSGQPPGPSPGPGPTADIKANGSDGPITVDKDSFVVFTWSFTNAPHCNLSSSNGSLNGMVGGSGAQTVRVSAPMSGTIACPGTNGGTATDTVQVNISAQVVYACSNGLDDDGDGKVDYPADPGCSSPTDNDEYNAPPPALSCAGLNAKYVRTDGSMSTTITMNQSNIGIRIEQMNGWPSHCETFYGTNRSSVIKAIGTVPFQVCSGGGCFYYYGGKFGTVSPVWPGDADVFAQIIIMENMGQPNQRWVIAEGANMRYSQPWKVVSGLTSLLGMEMPEGPKWVEDSRVPGGRVCLTFECR